MLSAKNKTDALGEQSTNHYRATPSLLTATGGRSQALPRLQSRPTSRCFVVASVVAVVVGVAARLYGGDLQLEALDKVLGFGALHLRGAQLRAQGVVLLQNLPHARKYREIS